jgi:hypothetical protein
MTAARQRYRLLGSAAGRKTRRQYGGDTDDGSRVDQTLLAIASWFGIKKRSWGCQPRSGYFFQPASGAAVFLSSEKLFNPFRPPLSPKHQGGLSDRCYTELYAISVLSVAPL